MLDQYGRPVWRGDTVTLTGTVIDSIPYQPEWVNCTVLLDQGMPPAGTQVKVNLNSQQVVKQGPGELPYYRPLPVTYSRLEAEESARQAILREIYSDLANVKRMVELLMFITKQERER